MNMQQTILLILFSLLPLAVAEAGSSIAFTDTPSQMTAGERTYPYTSSRIKLTDAAGKISEYSLRYQHLYYTDDIVPSGLFAGQFFGGLIGADGNPLKDKAGKEIVSDVPDGNTLIMDEQGQIYLMSHFEYVSKDSTGKSLFRNYPMFSAITSLQQQRDGNLKVSAFDKHQYRETGGIWTPCLATATAWGTVLSDEEFEPDARLWAMGRPGGKAQLDAIPFMQHYLNEYPVTTSVPYRYGQMIEARLGGKGQLEGGVRHYSLGRFSHEKILVMPDQRTFYMSDDRDFAGFFMAIADKAGDLSANTLYAVRWDKTSGSAAGRADLQWIRLGHATDAEINKIVEDGISFLDIFDTAPVPAIGFVTVRTGDGHKREYLRLKPGMETAAAFLESRRYAAYIGATTEFSKPEGMAFNLADKKIYLAMSNVVAGMANDHGNIRLDEIVSGAVYEVALNAKRPEDQFGDQIGSQWVAGSMHSIPALTGVDRAVADKWGNTADVNAIANPDNLSFSPSSRYLFIGEDTGKHVNNYLWAWHIDSGKLVRLLSVPAGAEIGGLQVVENLNGFMYIFCNYQHPGGKGAATDALELTMAEANPDFDRGRYRHAGIGYLIVESVAPGKLPWMQER